jgi:putative transposase
MKSVPWPHAPVHEITHSGVFLVTAGTYRKLHHFRGRQRLEVLQRGLLKVATDYGWQLEAWAIFSNHYHFVGRSTNRTNVVLMLRELHVKTAGWVNRLDDARGRPVWHNFWETRLTFQRSYFARLNYVHQNAVKHGLVSLATDYSWCSAAWLEKSASPAQAETIRRFKIDKLKVLDSFEPLADW